MITLLLPAIRSTLVLAVLTGLVFPLLITGIAQLAFPDQANGSLMRNRQGAIFGSRLIGQSFAKPEYFHPRPSAAGGGYAGEASGGTNLGPTSVKLLNGTKGFAGVSQLAEQVRTENGLPSGAMVPVDAVTRSGSGLDPHISVPNAMLQVARVAKARNISEDIVREVLRKNTESPDFGFLGESRVNVLLVNLSLDQRTGR